ncbi:hypothetical protein ACQP0C_32140 [Nocardia sp. CA-129566]|uniref:hypothetical protein n=1 Tax=Nocardia sp. CA-129566 TaxID=3239976 RepID=UPI003D973D2C
MNPMWGSNREPNLDPEVDAAVRNLMAAVADLDTARIQFENLDISALFGEPTTVDEEFMSDLAAVPTASPELQAFAARVHHGECQWREIEQLARPLPPEVAELKISPRFTWQWDPQPPPPAVEPRPRRRDNNTVGPSDWPDDFDEYPASRSWLV